MIEYLYSLVRYVPDPRRMEPINVAVILQGGGRTDIKISPHAAKRKEIDTAVFQQWRSFLLEEIRGQPTPLFQPDRDSPRYFDYLGRLCDSTVTLTPPLIHSVVPGSSFVDVLESLYNRLVAPPEPLSAVNTHRATGLFRVLAGQKHFIRRGMTRHTHITAESRRLWMAYRQIVNGEVVAIDKVEVDNHIGATANEIERLPHILEHLREFVAGRGIDRPTRYYLLADPLVQPFTDQSAAEFEAMRDDLLTCIDRVRDSGGHVIQSPGDAQNLVNELDQRLPPLAAVHT